MRLVRSKGVLVPPTRPDGVARWPPLPQLGGAPLSLEQYPEAAFRNAASERVLQAWSAYLASPESASDAGIAAIRAVVQVLNNVLAQRGEHAQPTPQRGVASAGAATAAPRPT